MLDDIEKWEDVVKFPNLDEYDWEGSLAMQSAIMGADRDQRVVEYGMWNGQFLRLTHLMGFENALCAMLKNRKPATHCLLPLLIIKLSWLNGSPNISNRILLPAMMTLPQKEDCLCHREPIVP